MPKTVKMPSAEEIKAAYTGSGSRAAAEYSKAIDKVTGFVSAASSESAEANYSAGVTRAVTLKLRAKGITAKVTDESWKKDAKEKGATIIGTRIAGAGEKQARGFADFRGALEGLSLPDKVPGDPLGNLSRNAGRVVATMYNVKARKVGATEVPVPG